MWHREMVPGFQIDVQLATLLAILVTTIILTRSYIRRRNSVLRTIPGPPSSSIIFGWSLWYTFATLTVFIHRCRKRRRRLAFQICSPVRRYLVSERMSRREGL